MFFSFLVLKINLRFAIIKKSHFLYNVEKCVLKFFKCFKCVGKKKNKIRDQWQ